MPWRLEGPAPSSAAAAVSCMSSRRLGAVASPPSAASRRLFLLSLGGPCVLGACRNKNNIYGMSLNWQFH